MKAYPSITTKIDFAKRYCLFDKLDGSNIRAEWNSKRGFYKFGSRTQLLTSDQTALYPSIEYINNFTSSTGERISDKLRTFKSESVVCFFEWAGPNSFAGSHTDDISEMSVVLLDVSLYKNGLMRPEKFIEHFAQYNIPKILYNGKMDEDMFHAIRNRTLNGMTFEGVVGKELDCTKDGRHTMFKTKSNDWLNKLKETCNGNLELFNRMK